VIRLLPASLKRTVLLVLLGFAAALSALHLIYHVPRAERAVEEEHRERLRQELSRLQSTLEYLLLKEDFDGVRREVAILASNRNYTLVVLTDDQDEVIASTRRVWLDRRAADVLPQFAPGAGIPVPTGRDVQVLHKAGEDVLLGYAGIPMGGGKGELRSARMGRLLFEYDLSRAVQAVRSEIMAQSLYWTGCVMTLAAVLWVIFHFLLTRRTERLVRAAGQLAAGNLAARSALPGRDELGQLSRAFDAMADNIGHAQQRLREELAERIEMQRALHASEEQYRAMFDASIDGLALLNLHGEVVDINPALWTMFGYEREELLAASRLQRAGKGLCLAVDDILRSIPIDQPFHAEVSDQRKDGAALELDVHGIRMQYQSRPHLLIIARDVTEKKRAAEELARQREMLHQREKLAALGSLLAGVAHELNNPLSVVVARAAMLQEHDDPATRSAATKIHAAAERCARIVRTFLAMARKQQPERVPVAVREVVSAALDLTGYALKTSGVEVSLDLDVRTPPVLADPDQLHQVFMNLIINAHHALQERVHPRELRVSSTWDAGAGTVRIDVADNGPGIPAAILNRIFEPYFTTKPSGAGTGVGLAVCLGIVEAHGGTLSVDSTEGRGTVFTVRLPAAVGYEARANEADAEEPDGSGHSVLVVDDEPEVRALLAEILLGSGHRVTSAASGNEALERLATERFDVIVTDIRMPGLDGIGLYGEIERRWPECAGDVIFVSGDTLTSHLREFAERTGRPVIEKPFMPNEVRRLVGEVVGA
jgi:two-component system NtrC family sensor kinase